MLGMPFGGGLSLDCGSSFSSGFIGGGLSLDCGSSFSSGFILSSSCPSWSLVSGIMGFFSVVEEILSSTVPSA